MTAMSSDGTELPEYLGFNETTGQIYGYTLKEGFPLLRFLSLQTMAPVR